MEKNKLGIPIHTVNTDSIIWSVNSIQKDEYKNYKLTKLYRRCINYKLFGFVITIIYEKE